MSGFAKGESIEEVWQLYPSQLELFRFLAYYWVACYAGSEPTRPASLVALELSHESQLH